MSEAEPGGDHLRWPVTLLTGMLGSGKTTLLRHVLADPAMRGTAVLVNEIGEIGLDHHLIERVDGETVLMRSGCLCCTLRADLPQTLNALRRRWLNDETLNMRRVVIETTGLANPVPILHQLATNPLVAGDFPLSVIVVTVDAQHLLGQLTTRPEAHRQIAVADQLILTKTDIVPAFTSAVVRARLHQLNVSASIVTAINGAMDATLLTGHTIRRGKAARAWAGDPHLPDFGASPTGHAGHDHGQFGTLALRAEKPQDWTAVEQCLSAIINEIGPDLLRLKGILDIVGSDRPVVVHGVQNAFYPIEWLDAWPDVDHHSRLMLIFAEAPGRRQLVLSLSASSGISWRTVH